MLGVGRYLLGAAELAWLVGFAWVGAARVLRIAELEQILRLLRRRGR